MAINAIALAAWDLAAKSADVSCAAAWGAGDVKDLDCYWSGPGFEVSVPEHQLAEVSAEARRAHFRHVKFRAGLDPTNDAGRFTIVREYFPEDGAVAVDALHGWDVAKTRTFIDEINVPLMWLEDPVPNEQLSELRDLPQPIAAGESLGTYEQLRALTDAARVDIVLPDVMVLGGPAHFLSTAGKMRRAGVRVGAHIFPDASAHLLACLDRPGPVEVFAWSDPLLEEPLRPRPSGRLPLRGPGFGVNMNTETVTRLGHRAATFGS